MSGILKGLCLGWVGVMTTAASAQPVARTFWVPAGDSPASYPSGPTIVYANQGDTVSMVLFIQGLGADLISAGAQVRTNDDSCLDGGAVGGVQVDCASAMIDAGAATHPGWTINTVQNAATQCSPLDQNSGVDCGIETIPGSPAGFFGFVTSDLPGSGPRTVTQAGVHQGQIDFVVSADACGDHRFGALDTPPVNPGAPNSIVFDANQVPVDTTFENLIIRIAPQNDDCADAESVGDGTHPYDSTCGTSDGPTPVTACGPGNVLPDVWFEYTASCTGDLDVTASAGNAVIYGAGIGCPVLDGDAIDCGNNYSVVVAQNSTYLIQVGGDGVEVAGDLGLTCRPFCTAGLPSGDPTYDGECGPNSSVCLIWDCQPANGGCVEVSTDPNDANNTTDGVSCDDGLFCTVDDACGSGTCSVNNPRNCSDGAVCTVDSCDEAGNACVNTDINSIPCPGGLANCPAAAADCIDDGAGPFCVCIENPELCLNAAPAGPAPSAGACGYTEGGQIEVTVDMAFSTQLVCAAQFFLSYDTSGLDFKSITPGGGVFTTVLVEFVDEVAGTIDYVVGYDPGGICLGTSGPATVATILFNASGECKNQGVSFRPHNPPTRLGGAEGQEICPAGHFGPDGICGNLVEPCNSGKINVDSTAPEVNCPDFKGFGNADCGGVVRCVNWAPITATDNCDGDLPVNCQISHNAGAPVDHLLNSGGCFPPGVTTIDCSGIADSCGNSSDCVFQVGNSGQNGLHVEVELSPTMQAGPIVRGIEFEVTDCGNIANPVTIGTCADTTFGFPYNIPGHGVSQAKVPPGNYACVTARDPLHTLNAVCEVTCQNVPGKGDVWFASFKGAKDLSDDCHWLVNGNLNGLDGDGIGRIDVIDFVSYLAAVANNPLPGANTPCGTPLTHGDINGDGKVSLLDFSFILINLFNNDKAGCDPVCNPAPAPPINPGRESISVDELVEMGFGREAITADVNRDGVVDLTDMALHLQNGGVDSGSDDGRDLKNGRDIRGSRSVRGLR